MARRPSTVSAASLASPRVPLQSLQSPDVISLATKSPFHVISQSGGLTYSKSQDAVADFDPDELFANCTVAEVRAKQTQLRADAEAKQEDLRIMVGERYRDLLQASSSIISIASSAERVQEAIEEAVTIIQSQRASTTLNHVSQSGKDDSHLQTLQVLSAHVKLLLDAPEHLWRLIEREKYFQAAWLFLLARVVHRSLIRDEPQDEESWVKHGINILEQFPLIQRQWETVSHFRTQIIHRATLSLRLYDKTPEETCGTLLTLHVLDSRPLAETLTIYLSQRTRTLSALLAKSLDNLEQRSNGFTVNSGPSEGSFLKRAGSLPASAAAFAVRNAIKTALEALSQTLYAARAVFGSSASARSLAERVLDSIQSERLLTPPAAPPAELLLNTQVVLNSLPSSSFVSLLPADIRSYRPFVDLSSVSSSLPQQALHDKLDGWFNQSSVSLGDAFGKWLASLDVVEAVWKVRSFLRKWVVHSSLLAPEVVTLTELLDNVFRARITGIWKAILLRSEKEFSKALGSLGSDNEDDMLSPLHSLYRSLPALQPPPGSGSSPFDPGFHTYKATLTQRLGGRAPRLHEVMRVLEDAASSLQRDLTRMFTDGEHRERLVIDLTKVCPPEAQALCARVASMLRVFSEELMASPDIGAVMNRLLFYAHVARELSTSSFIRNIARDQAVETSFREEMDTLFQRAVSCWEEHTISKLVSHYVRDAMIRRRHSGSACSHPSPTMMECLYLLSSSIQNLGMSHHPYLMTTPQRMIVNFSLAFVRNTGDGDLQLLYDLSFLLHLASRWRNTDVTALRQVIDRLRSRLANSLEHDPDHSASELLSRTQMLLSALLPRIPETCEGTPKENSDKMAGMLTHGVPAVDAQFVSAVELAPASTRLPLLLIDAR